MLADTTAATTEGKNLQEALHETAFAPVAADIGKLAALKARLDDEEGDEPTPAAITEQLRARLHSSFGVNLDPDAPFAKVALSAGLLVAGAAETIDDRNGGTSDGNLAAGIKAVTEKSNQAIERAQKLNKGIDVQLSVQRTMVFKR